MLHGGVVTNESSPSVRTSPSSPNLCKSFSPGYGSTDLRHQINVIARLLLFLRPRCGHDHRDPDGSHGLIGSCARP
jgi:hypothetical protein